MRRPLAIIASFAIAAGGLSTGSSAALQLERRVNLPDGTVLGPSAGPVLSSDSTVGFLAPALGDAIVAFNVATGQLIGTVPGHGGASGISIDEGLERRLLAVTAPNDPANGFPASVTVVDASAPARMRTDGVFELPGALELARDARAVVVPGQRFGLVPVAGPTAALLTFDLASNRQVGALTLAGPISGLSIVASEESLRAVGVSAPANAVFTVEIGAFGELLPVASFEVPSGHQLAASSSVSISSDGRIGYVATETGALFSFEVETGALLDQIVVGGSAAGLTVYHAADRDILAVTTSSTERERVSQSGVWVAEATADGRLRAVRSFSLETGDPIDRGHRAVFSADGQTVVVPGATGIYFCEIATGSVGHRAVTGAPALAVAAPLANSVVVVTMGRAGDHVEILPFSGAEAVPSPEPAATPSGSPVAAVPLRADRLTPSSVERSYGKTLYLTVVGSGFVSGGHAIVQGRSLPISVDHDGARAVVAVPPELLASGERLGVEIENPDGSRSPSLNLFLLDPDAPKLASITPATVSAGARSIDLTIGGQHFRAGATVQVLLDEEGLERRSLKTYRLSFDRLVAELPAELRASAASLQVVVVDRDGVTESSAAKLTVTEPAKHARRRQRPARSDRRLLAVGDRKRTGAAVRRRGAQP